MPFTYKKILVVGATSGIGKAMAQRFIENGAFVVASGRRKQNLDELVEEYGSDKVAAIPFDITHLDAIPHFVESIMTTHEDLDCVFLNSGIQRGYNFREPETVSMDSISLEFTTNYLSYVALTKAFLPYFLPRKTETSLIYNSSGLALVPVSRCPNYCATKAALHQFILVLRRQLHGTNVKVIEIFPPAVQTEIHDAKNQPDFKGGSSFGMPLKEFTDEAFEELSQGLDQVTVGTAKTAFNAFERTRQEIFTHYP